MTRKLRGNDRAVPIAINAADHPLVLSLALRLAQVRRDGPIRVTYIFLGPSAPKRVHVDTAVGEHGLEKAHFRLTDTAPAARQQSVSVSIGHLLWVDHNQAPPNAGGRCQFVPERSANSTRTENIGGRQLDVMESWAVLLSAPKVDFPVDRALLMVRGS